MIFRIAVFVLACLFWGVTPVLSWQKVQVDVDLDEDKSIQELQQQGLREGFSLAVVQESQRMVPGELSDERKKILGEHLEWKINDLVMGYRIFSIEEVDGRLQMDLQVNVDNATLRNILQRTGVYYTSTVPWKYGLSTRGSSPGDFGMLQRLQKITGVEVDNDAHTSVSLVRLHDGSWSGSIDYKDISFEVSGGDLNRVWFDLWAFFFTHPEVMSQMTMDFTLKTTGWVTIDAIMYFDEILLSWDQKVEKGSIQYIHTDVPSFRAGWSLTSLNPDLLRQSLEEYLSSRGIYYSIDENNRQD